MEDDLGFYYAIFLPEPHRDRAKVWIDGDEYYTFFSRDDFLKLAERGGIPSVMYLAMQETTFFIWDVAGKKINRVSAQTEQRSLREQILRKTFEDKAKAEKETSVAEKYWRSEEELRDNEAPKIHV